MKRLVMLLLVLAMAFSVVACGSQPSAPGPAPETPGSSDSGTDKEPAGEEPSPSTDLRQVKYVLPRGLEALDDAHVWAAIEMGYFEEEGLEVIVEQSIGTTDVRMVSFGQAEFCIPAPVGLMVAREAGMPLVSVFQIDTRENWAIAMKSDSDIKTWQDVKGKRVALGDAAWQTYFEVFLVAAGLELDDVEYVVAGENRAQAVQQDQADLVLTWEKEYQLWQAKGMDFKVLRAEEIVPGCANSLIVTMDMVKNEPEVIEKFGRAYAKGLLFTKLNPEAAADIVTKKFPALNLSREEAYPAIEGLVYITHDHHVEEFGYGWHDKDEWEIVKANGLLTDSFTEDIPVEEYYTNEFVEAFNEFDPAQVEADAAAYTFD